MLDRNPFGGCLTRGIDSDGEMTKVVPGGSASLPSFVIHSILFCREWGMFSLATPSWSGDAMGSNAANAMLSSTRGNAVSIANLWIKDYKFHFDCRALKTLSVPTYYARSPIKSSNRWSKKNDCHFTFSYVGPSLHL